MKNALLAVPLLVAGVAVTAGCSASSSAAAPSSSAPTGAASSASAAAQSSSHTASSASTGKSTGTAASKSTGTSASGTPACTSAHLAASVGQGPGPGMNQNHVGLQLKNTGSSACTLYGYPGVSWVSGANGKQVGAGATRQSDPTGGPEKTVTLAPGALASAPFDMVNASVFDKSQCDPVPVRGLRVYPPGEKAALFIQEGTPGNYGACSKTTSQPTLFIGYLESGPQPTGNGSAG